MSEIADVVIIGGGPVGLYAGYHAGTRQMQAKIIDSKAELGGQLRHLYPKKDIFDVFGMPKIAASKLVENLKHQIMQYQPAVCLNSRVTAIHRNNDVFEVITDKGVHRGLSVLLAIGPGAFVPESIFDASPKEQMAKGLFLEPDGVTQFAGRHVLVCGGKEEAAGWSIAASTVADRVTLVNWGFATEIEEAYVDARVQHRVVVKTPYELYEIHGESHIESATIINIKTHETECLDATAVLMARGQITNLELVRTWGPEMECNGVKVNRLMKTSVPGMFAAGDIAVYPGKQKTIGAGAGEAAMAINSARTYLDSLK